ncbi:hypothetical protein MLD38_014143 [Melastoma candidum]|uniref:Uncharacterized protein n=1 Tax=Melastoma candidum TaxID=119954 RepID=A0ACB9RBX2_9MYRT|nr:hypothetical protein MLD38_014143 [Melastoma candidum]
MLSLRHLRTFRRYLTSSSAAHPDSILDSFLTAAPETNPQLLQNHSLIITSGNSANPFLSAKLISGYASFDDLISSCKVFDLVPRKDIFLWNSIVKAHFSNGLYSQALEFYSKMRTSGVSPNGFSVPMVVAACAEQAELWHGMRVHGVVMKFGLLSGDDSCAVGSSLIFMYMKCGQVVSGQKVFEEMTARDVVAWTTLVIGYVHNGEDNKGLGCLVEMVRLDQMDSQPNFRTTEGALKACGNRGAISECHCLHGFAVKRGLDCCQNVQASILSMYSKCDSASDSFRAFRELVDKDIVSWTTIIGLCSRAGLMGECFEMFLEMLGSGIVPDGIVISCILFGLSNTMNIPAGKAFHGLVVRRHVDLLVGDQVVSNSLISMYFKFGLFCSAVKLFETLSKQEKELWNIVIAGLGRPGMEEYCIKYFREMQDAGIESDSLSIVSVISSCSRLGLKKLGYSLHCFIMKNSAKEDVSVSNSLIDLYGSLHDVEAARQIFSNMKKDLVSWNSMMSLYNFNDQYKDALALFDKMIALDLKPNNATLVTVLTACSSQADLQNGERINRYIHEQGICMNVPLATALVDMYAKCGKINRAKQLFDLMEERDVISWNVMIFAYAIHGDAEAAFEIFQLMENSNERPNALTFLGLLSACARTGLLEEGMSVFSRMHQYSIKPELKHYSCLVELLGKTGDLKGSEKLILSLPEPPDAAIWATLLSTCTSQEEFDTGVRVAKHAIRRHPENDGCYVGLSNICSSIGNWGEAELVRGEMKNKGMKKQAAWSAL